MVSSMFQSLKWLENILDDRERNQGLMPGMGKDFCKASRVVSGPAQPSTSLVPGVLSVWVKRARTRTWTLTCIECQVKNVWCCASTVLYVCMLWCLTLSRRMTYIYIYICHAVSPLNSRTATWPGDLIPAKKI